MLPLLAQITVAFAALAVIASTARGVPPLNAIAPPSTRAGIVVTWLVGFAFLGACIFHLAGESTPLAFAWPVALVYLAFCLGRNLRAAGNARR